MTELTYEVYSRLLNSAFAIRAVPYYAAIFCISGSIFVSGLFLPSRKRWSLSTVRCRCRQVTRTRRIPICDLAICAAPIVDRICDRPRNIKIAFVGLAL